ncbi:MAG: hypothetical protein SGCHY_003263 [Lobulomycetales sp.]
MRPEFIEFEAEDYVVQISPSCRMEPISLVTGTVGPFRPPLSCAVPLWLAVYLKSKQKASIQPPPWLELANLKAIVEGKDHLEGTGDLEGEPIRPLPDAFFEIGAILMSSGASEDIPNATRIWTLLGEIYHAQSNAFRTTFVKEIDPVHYKVRSLREKIQGLHNMGINEIKPFALKAFNHLHSIVASGGGVAEDEDQVDEDFY